MSKRTKARRGNLTRALNKISHYFEGQHCGCFTPSEILTLYREGIKTHKYYSSELTSALFNIKIGNSNLIGSISFHSLDLGRKLMITLTLEGKSLKGKQRIKQLGNTWRLIRKFNPSLINRPWFIVPIDKDDYDVSSRWIHPTDDPDFRVVSTNTKVTIDAS